VEERANFCICYGASKGAASKISQDSFGISLWLRGDDFESFRGDSLQRQITEDGFVAGRRPGFQQRAFHVDMLNDQSGPRVLVGSDFFHRRGQCGQSFCKDADAIFRFQLEGEFNGCGSVCGDREVVNEAFFCDFLQGSCGDSKTDGFTIALKAVSGDAKPIFSSHMAAEVPHGDANVGGFPRRKNCDSVVGVAVDTAGWSNGFFFTDIKPFFQDPRLGFISNGSIQDSVSGIEVVLYQERRRMQQLCVVIESIGGRFRG